MKRRFLSLPAALIFAALLISCATLDRNYGSYAATEYPAAAEFPLDRLEVRGWAAARVEYDGTVYDVVAWRADEVATELVLYWPGRRDRYVGRLERAVRLVGREGGRAILAANAGMYHPDLRPVGLYRENGEDLFPLRRGAGEGNFGLLPNGVFYFSDEGFGIVETSGWEQVVRSLSPRFATQSGPMLLIDGEVHPSFRSGSPNRYVRSGVGVAGPGYRKVVFFVISERPVGFMDLARLFRERLGCGEALYLDGHTSRAWIPSLGREQGGGPFGPMLLATVPDGAPAVDFDFELRLQFSF